MGLGAKLLASFLKIHLEILKIFWILQQKILKCVTWAYNEFENRYFLAFTENMYV